MIEFKEYIPGEWLKPYVENFWILEITGSDVEPDYEERVTPLGFSEIIMHFGDLYAIKEARNYSVLPRALFTGQLTSSKTFKPTGATGILGVKFRPFGAYFFLPEPPQNFVDQSTGLRNIFEPGVIERLESAILNSESHPEKLKLIESFLSEHFNDARINIPIEEIVSFIYREKGNIDVAELCKRFYCSQSKLERNFRKIIGLTPKKFCQIIKFNEILKEYKENKDILELACKYGYFDYSHFTKAFSSFSGFSPNQFKSVRKSITEKLMIEENADFLHQRKFT